MKIAIVGGGPSGLFMFKRLLEAGERAFTIDIYEKYDRLGAGMPYSRQGASLEHVTNVSGNEIPKLMTGLTEWVKDLDSGTLHQYGIDPEKFHEYRVLPRLLFGDYLQAQFMMLKHRARELGIKVNYLFGREVTDIVDNKEQVGICYKDECTWYNKVVICTGHHWPLKHENRIPGYFDSPYPPSKLQFTVNGPVALKGASLTAIDAIRTLARKHGEFQTNDKGKLSYKLNENHPNFRIVMHSRNGLLPAVRFHLDDTELGRDSKISPEELAKNRSENDGFLSLDYVFDHYFKAPIREKHPEFYEQIKHMNVEDFVHHMMELRESIDPFDLFKAEYAEAEKSIRRQQSVYWKEMLAALSYTMNYPAKYFSAEDMMRLQQILMPLISLVIAFVPQRSAEEMIALHDAGILTLVGVGDDSRIEPNEAGGIIYHFSGESVAYPVFIDCTGQPHLSYDDFPYTGLHDNVISPARIRFRNPEKGRQELESGNDKISTDQAGHFYLRVPGIAINDHFQLVDNYHAFNERIYIMAVPFISGYNPDYSGLDFCETASNIIVNSITQSL